MKLVPKCLSFETLQNCIFRFTFSLKKWVEKSVKFVSARQGVFYPEKKWCACVRVSLTLRTRETKNNVGGSSSRRVK